MTNDDDLPLDHEYLNPINGEGSEAGCVMRVGARGQCGARRSAHPAPEADDEPMDVFQLKAQRAGTAASRRPNRERSNTMTAPDYMIRAVTLLTEHSGWGETGPDIYGAMEVECFDCGERLGDAETLIAEWEAQTGNCHMDHADHGRHPANDRVLAWHQAELLAAAGLIPTTVEWGVRFVGADAPMTYDREADARLVATDIDAEGVVSRAVTDWKDET